MRSRNVLKCCCARTVVGTRMATCFATHDGLERGADGDFRFAKADIAADQAIHRLGAFHVGFCFGNRADLIGSFLRR